MIDQKFIDLINDHQVLTIACVTADGLPRSAALFYAFDSENSVFYFLSEENTLHGKSISQNPFISATIQRDRQKWMDIRGIQLRGKCSRLSGKEANSAKELYAKRFTFLKNPAANLKAALGKVSYWEFRPEWMRLIDNAVAFGHKKEWNTGTK